jgi:adenylate kinase family enzyme
MQSYKPTNILLFGVPGAGKSTIANTLLTKNPDANLFIAG